MIRFYLVPAVTVGTTRGPKYFGWRGGPAPLFSAGWEARDYGSQPLMLLAADMSDPDDALLVAQGDVTKFADDLDAQLGAGLAAMQTAMEALKLPAQLLTANTTHRQVVRGVMGIFSIAQCMQGKGRDIFAAGVTLSTTMAQIAATPRADLDACFRTLGYTAIADDATGATTVRDLLTSIANVANPSHMMGVVV
jgi:hypothetical protein